MRVLRRPMFGGGSTGTGITSGLAPRQGYADPAGQVNQLDDLAGLTLPQMRELSQSMAYKPRGTNVYDFLTEFGLNIASTPPQGNIFQTAAASAKDPYQRFTQRKSEADAARYVSEADMFKTLIGAQADIKGGEGGKSYRDTAVAGEVRRLTEEIFDAKSEIQKLESQGVEKGSPGTGDVQINQKRIDELKKEIALDRSELNNLKKKSQYASSMLKSDTFRDNLIMTIMARLKMQTLPDGELKYPKGDNDENLYKDAYREMLRFLEETETSIGQATGGRVGYQQGLSVDKLSELNQATVTPFQESPQMEQAETMPEELTGVTYDELRRRLPTEVSDEIVRLLVSSAEAMEDFAMIQTEEDLANFNQKYSVELVLPSEA